MRRSRAFSLVEILIAIIILAILGSALMLALWVFWGGFLQTRDVVGARQDIEHAFQTVGLQLSNSSMGMPNNRGEPGAFSVAFRGVVPDRDDPIMAYMGGNGELWGGPITLANFGYNPASPSVYDAPPTSGDNYQNTMVQTTVPATGYYEGRAIYYTWGVPVIDGDGDPVRLVNFEGQRSIYNDRIDANARRIVYRFANDSQVGLLSDFQADWRDWSIVPAPATTDNRGRDMRSWVVFPTVRLPLLVNEINATGTPSMTLLLAPGHNHDPNDPTTMELRALLGAYTDLHAIMACRIYVDENNMLVQEIFGSNFRDMNTNIKNILAIEVAGLWFRFDRENHLLTMTLAARGEEVNIRGPLGAEPAGWPIEAPSLAGENRRRITVQSMTWRIRN
jgi:prepilin-type N-terminal cleavage/methylation domain-containing protein